MNPVSGALASQKPPDAKTLQITKSTQEFEALLLNQLLGPLQETLAAVPGQDPERNRNMYAAMGTEYLALGLARAGGLGIARMIAGELTRVTGEVIQK
jgi:Rod binding domain-containing protein